jgi:hypothetical protein
MRVLAASFPDDDLAWAARDHLINALALQAGQVWRSCPRPPRKDLAILAGRFEEAVVATACDVVTQFGGTLVMDIDDEGGNA